MDQTVKGRAARSNKIMASIRIPVKDLESKRPFPIPETKFGTIQCDRRPIRIGCVLIEVSKVTLYANPSLSLSPISGRLKIQAHILRVLWISQPYTHIYRLIREAFKKKK